MFFLHVSQGIFSVFLNICMPTELESRKVQLVQKHEILQCFSQLVEVFSLIAIY